MIYYDPFDCKINCEELISVTPEEEAEINALIAQENEAKEDFTTWLESLEESEREAFLEQQAFEKAIEQTSTVNSSQGEILIKRDCSHLECSQQSRCKREIRYGGIAI
jgi:hypothetical protein